MTKLDAVKPSPRQPSTSQTAQGMGAGTRTSAAEGPRGTQRGSPAGRTGQQAAPTSAPRDIDQVRFLPCTPLFGDGPACLAWLAFFLPCLAALAGLLGLPLMLWLWGLWCMFWLLLLLLLSMCVTTVDYCFRLPTTVNHCFVVWWSESSCAQYC